MKTLRAGLIGAGSFGELHLQAYQAIPGVEVVAVCDSNKERLGEITGKYQVARTFTDFRDLCRLPELDLVSIATPENAHLEPVLEAARAGKHIFLEKPIATSLEDSQKMVDATSQAGVFLMVGH